MRVARGRPRRRHSGHEWDIGFAGGARLIAIGGIVGGSKAAIRHRLQVRPGGITFKVSGRRRGAGDMYAVNGWHGRAVVGVGAGVCPVVW